MNSVMERPSNVLAWGVFVLLICILSSDPPQGNGDTKKGLVNQEKSWKANLGDRVIRLHFNLCCSLKLE